MTTTKQSMRSGGARRTRAWAGAVLAALALSRCPVSAPPPPFSGPGGPASHDAALQPAARSVAEGLLLPGFSQSLEMREAADFLITPAALVQEAISAGVIPTYPTE